MSIQADEIESWQWIAGTVKAAITCLPKVAVPITGEIRSEYLDFANRYLGLIQESMAAIGIQRESRPAMTFMNFQELSHSVNAACYEPGKLDLKKLDLGLAGDLVSVGKEFAEFNYKVLVSINT